MKMGRLSRVGTVTVIIIAVLALFHIINNSHRHVENANARQQAPTSTTAGSGQGAGIKSRNLSTTRPGTSEPHRGRGSGAQGTQEVRRGKPLDPQVASNMLMNVLALVDRRDFLQALAAVDDMLSMNPPTFGREKALLERARLLAVLDRKADAINVLSSLIESTNDDMIFHEALARYFILNRDLDMLDREISNREAELKDDPGNTRLMEIIAGLAQHAQRTNEERLIRQSLAEKVQNIENLKRLLALSANTTDIPYLTNLVGQLVVVDPVNASVYLLKQAKAERDTQEPISARSTCDRILSIQSVDTETLFQVGLILEEIGNLQRALEVFTLCRTNLSVTADQQRCELEVCRVRVKMGQTDVVRGTLEQLATNGLSTGIRNIAIQLLNTER